MTLGLNTEEVVQALDAKGYIDAMEEAFTELGKGAAINSPRTETGIPLLKYGADERIKTNARELLRDIVVSATTSLTPVFEAKWLNEGTHLGSINIVEADRQSFTRCDLVVVNARPFAGAQATSCAITSWASTWTRWAATSTKNPRN
ncbi:MAG TPA: hypothetical protein VGL70_09335 [Candidatus Binatia bacterium]|jgi:ornithine cyclodeaminase/alanine dehydrogenase-like protein (mu-crystallin family)